MRSQERDHSQFLQGARIHCHCTAQLLSSASASPLRRHRKIKRGARAKGSPSRSDPFRGLEPPQPQQGCPCTSPCWAAWLQRQDEAMGEEDGSVPQWWPRCRPSPVR